MSITTLLLKGSDAPEFHNMRHAQAGTYQEVARLDPTKSLYQPGGVVPVFKGYGNHWVRAPGDTTGYYRIANRMIIQGPTGLQRSEKVVFWEDIKTKMHQVYLKTGVVGVGSLILSTVALLKLASPLIAATLFAAALASLCTSLKAKNLEDEATDEAKMWEYHPADWALLQVEQEELQSQTLPSLFHAYYMGLINLEKQTS